MAITCHDLDTLLPAHLDGELTDAELADLEAHLGACDACRGRGAAEAEDHARLRRLLAAPPPPAGLRRNVLAALDGADRERTARARRRAWGWSLPAAASMAAAAALAVFALDAVRTPTASPVAALSVHRLQEDAVASRFRAAPLVTVSSPVDLQRSVAEYLRVPVTAPTLQGSAMRGWQPTQIGGRVAAKLVYEVTTPRRRFLVDVHLLDGRDVGPDPEDRLRVNDRELWVSSQQGINTVAFTDPRGVGYVFSSDMPRGELIDLVVRSPVVKSVNDRVFGD